MTRDKIRNIVRIWRSLSPIYDKMVSKKSGCNYDDMKAVFNKFYEVSMKGGVVEHNAYDLILFNKIWKIYKKLTYQDISNNHNSGSLLSATEALDAIFIIKKILKEENDKK